MASFSCGVEMEVCRKFVGSVVMDSKVLGSSGDKNGLEDEESESLPTGFKTVYKIFETCKLIVVWDADRKL